LKRLIYFFIAFTFITYLSLTVSAMLPLIAENKTNLSADFLQDGLIRIAAHPINTIKLLIQTKNPLFIGLESFAFVYSIIISLKGVKRTKQGWEVDPHEQSHGSARFAKPSEIFIKDEFISGSKKQVFEELKASLALKEGDI